MDIKPTNFATIARMLMSTAHQINSSPCEPHTPVVANLTQRGENAAPAQDRLAHITAHKSRNPSYLSQQAGRHDNITTASNASLLGQESSPRS